MSDWPGQEVSEWPGSAVQETYRGRILPISKDENGKVRFDPQAGLLGPLVRAFTLPSEVYKGQVDPKSDEGIGRAFEMATVVSPVSVAARAGERALPGARMAVKPGEVRVPTQAELKAAADAGYTRMRAMGVDYAPEGVASMTGGIGKQLAQEGFNQETAPKTLATLARMADAPKPGPGEVVAVPLNGLESARKTLGQIAGSGDSDAKAAMVARRIIDQFIEKPPAEAVLAGPAAEAGSTLAGARSNYAAAMRSEDLTGIGGAAELRAAAANSGQNLGNSIRGRVASALIGDKLKGYSAEELAAAKSIVEGTRTQNALREAGNVLGGGGGMGAVVAGGAGAGAGALVAGPPGAAIGAAVPPIAGRIAKVLSNKSTERALGRLDELTRKRSALYDELAANPQIVVKDPDKRAALIKMLLMEQASSPTDR